MNSGKVIGFIWPWGVLCLQGICVFFLAIDVVIDLAGIDYETHIQGSDAVEYLVVAALAVSLAVSLFEVRRVLGRQKRMEQQINAASGAFAKLLDDHFDEWSLTPSERDVALLAIKGFSLAEIASLRQTREGTVKAQCNAIYRKAGVIGRPQLLSLFIDELLSGPLVPAVADG